MSFLSDYFPFHQKTLNLVIASIMIALVCVATIFFQIPIAVTGGYFNVGEAIIYISALVFGPIIGGLAGGVGAALADAMSPYFIFAPGTLVIKFCEGFIIGFIVYRVHSLEWEKWKIYSIYIIAVVTGGIIMVIGYFIYEAFILALGIPFALVEIPFNLTQLLIGALFAIPASIAIQETYPIKEFPLKKID
ncbi:MAG: ECF transporter S component [Candidatus Helarchaeota archaeon]